jgi:hypothetical protein
MGGMWGMKREGFAYMRVNFTEGLRNYLNNKNNHGGTDQVHLWIVQEAVISLS